MRPTPWTTAAIPSCEPRKLTLAIKDDVRSFYADAAGRCPCVITGEFNTDIAHLDDKPDHSWLHNLVPIHESLNRHLGALKGNYGSPTNVAVLCEFPGLDWNNLYLRATLHREQWHFRRAYACVRVGYYTSSRYYHAGPGALYEIMAECLDFARHVWDDDLIWALLDHDLLPLLSADSSHLRRARVAPLVRQIATLWHDLRRPMTRSAILREHDALLEARGEKVDKKTACSLFFRRGMDAVTREGRAGLIEGAAFAREALSLASTTEERVNALEVEPWLAEDRDDWRRVRDLLEEELVPRVLPLIRTFGADIERKRREGRLDAALLKIPPHLTPLNAAQVPMDYAVSIVKTDGASPAALRKVRELTALSMSVYDLMGTRPFMLTENVKAAYKEVAGATGDDKLQALAAGRCLLPRTTELLRRVSGIALDRLREAKS